MINTIRVVFLSLISLSIIHCTELEVKNDTDVLAEDFFNTDEDFFLFISSAYHTLRALTNTSSLIALQEIPSDEICLPIRGADWDDGGQWQRLHRHSWRSDDDAINNTWTTLYQGVNHCNRMLQALQPIRREQKEKYISEVRALRALYYYWLLDLFGQVPIVTNYSDTEIPFPSSSNQLFSFIEEELLDVIPKLLASPSIERMHQWSAHALLANLYVNAEIYTSAPAYQKALQHCDEVIDAGHYQLATDYFANFSVDNHLSPEIILTIPYDEIYAHGFSLSMMTLHPESNQTYNLQSQPWNGWCAVKDFYELYDDSDIRKEGSFVVGQQYTMDGDTLHDFFPDSLAPLDPGGTPIDFTPEINGLDSAYRQDGARVGKFTIAPHSAQNMSNDFPIFRFAQILMIKAEALWRLGQETEALSLINQIRSRAGQLPLVEMTAKDWVDELGREFFFEGKRRTDLIRWGTFFDGWWEKDQSEECKYVFPVPQRQLDQYPILNQNPCYP